MVRDRNVTLGSRPTLLTATTAHTWTPDAMTAAVQVYPRRKSLAKTTGSSDYLRGAKNTIVKPSSHEPLSIDLATILPYAGLSQKLAAAYLGLSLTALKGVCRKLGINKWSLLCKTEAELGCEDPAAQSKPHKHLQVVAYTEDGPASPPTPRRAVRLWSESAPKAFDGQDRGASPPGNVLQLGEACAHRCNPPVATPSTVCADTPPTSPLPRFETTPASVGETSLPDSPVDFATSSDSGAARVHDQRESPGASAESERFFSSGKGWLAARCQDYAAPCPSDEACMCPSTHGADGAWGALSCPLPAVCEGVFAAVAVDGPALTDDYNDLAFLATTLDSEWLLDGGKV